MRQDDLAGSGERNLTRLSNIEAFLARQSGAWPNLFFTLAGLSLSLGAFFKVAPVVTGSVVLCAVFLLLGYWMFKLQELTAKNEKKSASQLRIDLADKYFAAFSQSVEAFVGATWESAKVLLVTPGKRQDRCKSALRLILNNVRYELGPAGGVRACIFLVEEGLTGLSAWSDSGKQGRRTTRKFYPKKNEDDPDGTYERAIERVDWFVEDTLELGPYDPADDSKPWPYRTFAAWPISLEDRLYGVLTVDAKKKGDIKPEDLEKLRMFAAICATALAASDSPSIPIGGSDQVVTPQG